MNIVPKLNLNKHPNIIENNSLVYAENIKLSDDEAVLQNENTCVYDNTALSCLSPDKYQKGVNIIYALPCNTEIVFFVRPDNESNTLDVVRYNEKTQESYLVLDNFEYNEGTLLGTFTYNKEELIIAISEVVEEGNKYIPLKTFNLGKADNPITYINSDLHYLVPKVTIPTVKTSYTDGFAQKGWYYIFVRYKIDAHNYTQWFNTNESIFIDTYYEQNLLNYFISKDAVDALTDNIATKNTILMSDDTNIAKITFNIDIIKNLDIRYDNFQLGVVYVTNQDIKSFKTNDLNRYIDSIVFNPNNVIEYNSNDLLVSYYNYYNVKTLECINNRLYIGNYKENNNLANIDFSGITSILQEDIENVDSGSTSEIIGTEGIFTITPISGSTLESREVKANYTTIKVSITARIRIPYINATNFIRYQSSSGVRRWFDCKPTDTIVITYSYDGKTKTEEVLAEDFIYVPNIKSVIDETRVDCSGFYINRNGFVRVGYNGKITVNKIGNTTYGGAVIDNTFHDHGTYTKRDIYNVIQSATNILTSVGVYPNSYYNFFIHFIDEFGEITNGIPISNINLLDANNNPINLHNGLYLSSNIDVGKKLTLSIDINEIPDPFIGYFISYEKFENSISYKCYGTINEKTIKVYNEKFNYEETINFKFNKAKVFKISDSAVDDDKLNKNFTRGDIIGDYAIINKQLYVADSFNNVLGETHIELTIDTSIGNIKECIVYLYNDNIESLYSNEVKYLIPCTEIIYDTSTHIINTKNSFNSTNSTLYYPNKVYFDDATKIYKAIDANYANVIEQSPFYIYSFKDHFEIPNESIQFNNKPVTTYFPNKGLKSNDSYERSFIVGNIVDIKNTIDIFKFNYKPIYESYPKYLNWMNPKISYVYDFPKTLRRSNIIQDESYVNNWRKFDTEQYRNINENKGNIIKIVGIGKYFIVHTEHSMFLFNGTDTIKSEEGSIQLSSVDILNLNYQEVLTSKLGYAGLQKECHGIVGNFGYIWYDKADNSFYRYDNESIKNIDSDIKNFIKEINVEDVVFGDDKDNNRLFILLKCENENNNEILSYNYKINSFISFHTINTFNPDNIHNFDIKNTNFFSTKTKFYIKTVITQEFNIPKYDEEGNFIRYEKLILDVGNLLHFTKDVYSKSTIEIAHTNNYGVMKYLDNIIYKINKIDKTRSIKYSPVEGKDIHYAADSLQIYSEHCDTGIINIDTSKNLNSPDNYMTPYWRFGNWHFSAIRNNVTNTNLVADEKSRIFGNWFVVKFNFDTNDKVEIETLECKTSIAEY